MKIIALVAGVGLLVGAGGSAVSALPSLPSQVADSAPGSPVSPGSAGSSGPPDSLRLLEQQAPGWWAWPLEMHGGKPPPVVRPFDPPARRWLAGHRGVDLAAAPGAPVMAAGAGTVAFAGILFGVGVVVVSHGGVRTSYEPVDVGVRVGQRVARGDVLGTLAIGPADGSSGSVLHWGLLAGHGHAVRYYDPLLLLGLGHLRLEPATGRAEPLSL